MSVSSSTKLQALRTIFHIEGAKPFKKGRFQGHLQQLNLESRLKNKSTIYIYNICHICIIYIYIKYHIYTYVYHMYHIHKMSNFY